MKAVFLVKPSKVYQKSFENYVTAYQKINDAHYFNKHKKALDNFQGYIEDLFNYSMGYDLPEGDGAVSTFWLVEENEVVGVVRIRHKEEGTAGHIGYDISPDFRNRGYGNEILKLSLKESRNLGINEAVLTCNTENIASKKIIEKNKGKLLGTIYDEEEDEHLYKYIIMTE